MIQIILMLIIVPKSIYPLAKARGRNGLLWTLIAIGVFFAAELFIIFVYTVSYFLGVFLFGWSEAVEKQSFTFFVDLLALIGGLLSVEILRRWLSKTPHTLITSPPPPPDTF